jgi:phosphoribosylpyrophosphate synthetase
MALNQFSPKESETPVFSGDCLPYGQATAMEQPGVLVGLITQRSVEVNFLKSLPNSNPPPAIISNRHLVLAIPLKNLAAIDNQVSMVMYFFGDFRHKDYIDMLAHEYSLVSGNDTEVYCFCGEDFVGGEYKIRLVDGHCGKVRTRKDCTFGCKNPEELANKVHGKDAVWVVRGEYGRGWNPDKIRGMARFGSHMLKEGGRNFYGKKVRTLIALIPCEGFTKQDKIFYSTGYGPILGEPETLRMIRQDLLNSGIDLMIVGYPHDYRKRGWIRKARLKDEPYRILTDWKDRASDEVIMTEDWKPNVWAVDLSDLFGPYIRRQQIHIDFAGGADYTASSLVKKVMRDLGLWKKIATQTAVKRRSRAVAKDVSLKRGFDSKNVKGSVVGLFDDFALTCGTMEESVKDIDKNGALGIHIFLGHGEFVWRDKEGMDAYEWLIRTELKKADYLKMHATNSVDNPVGFIETEKLFAEDLNWALNERAIELEKEKKK